MSKLYVEIKILSLGVALFLLSCKPETHLPPSDSPVETANADPQVSKTKVDASTEPGSRSDSTMYVAPADAVSLPITPRVQQMRQKLLKPLPSTTNPSDDERLPGQDMLEALDALQKEKTIESANVLAELLFQPNDDFFKVTEVNGIKHYPYSYLCMDKLYFMLDDTPVPSDKLLFSEIDIPIWRKWWMQNRDNLKIRTKPAPDFMIGK